MIQKLIMECIILILMKYLKNLVLDEKYEKDSDKNRILYTLVIPRQYKYFRSYI